MSEFEQFTNQIEILKALFRLRGEELITESLKRMEQIFQTTERKWRCNLNRLKKVKYLLIAEAPPWSEDGEIRYFYNTFQPPLVNRIWHAFFPSKILPQSIDIALTALGEQGFLLIDTLPFSMKYSSQFRKKPLYKKLIKECLPFFMKKINDPMIRWAQEVRLAFALEWNWGRVPISLKTSAKPTGLSTKLDLEDLGSKLGRNPGGQASVIRY